MISKIVFINLINSVILDVSEYLNSSILYSQIYLLVFSLIIKILFLFFRIGFSLIIFTLCQQRFLRKF